MNEIKLSDQLGAMAIIDNLYARQIALEEHLDLPALRQRISQRIRDYYQQSGTVVDDRLIEEGVKSWFTQRLSYQAPALTLGQRTAAWLYLTSAIWLKGLGIVALCAALLVGYRAYETRTQRTALSQHIAAEITRNKGLDSEARKIASTLEQAKTVPLTYAMKPFASLGNEITALLAHFSQPQNNTLPDDTEQRKQRLNELTTLNNQQTSLLASANQLIDNVGKLLQADSSLTHITTDPQFNTYLTQDPGLADKLSIAGQAIQQNNPAMESAIAAVSAAVKQQKIRIERLKLFDEQKNKLLALPLSSADRKTLNTFVDSLQRGLGERSFTESSPPPEWFGALNRMKEMYNYVTEPLTFIVVDRFGEKSGVERTYDESGGRSWYLIAEAINGQGVAEPVWIKDSETGKEEKVATFGIRISRAEYEKLKKDKQEDGHIDHNIVGNKPANQLSVHYQRPVMDGRILNW